MRVLTWAVAALLLCPLDGLRAQEPVSTWAFGRLTPGQVLRVHTRTGVRLEGPFVSMAGPSLVVTSAGTETALPISAIDSLWVRRNVAAKGALVGAVISGLPALVLLTTVCYAVEETFNCADPGTVAAFTLGAAAGGALVGAIVGSRSSGWDLRYPRSGFTLLVAPLGRGGLDLGVSIRP